MRVLLPLLFLSVAAPALADPGDPDIRESRAARFEARREASAERPAPAPREDRPAPPPRIERPDRQPMTQGSFGGAPERRFDGGRSADGGGPRWTGRPADGNGGPRWGGGRRPDQPQSPPTGATGRPNGDSVADWRWRDRRGGDRPDATPPRPAVQIDGATYGYRDGRDPNRDRDRWRDRDGRRRDGGAWTGRDGRDGRYDRDGWRDRRGDTAWRPDWRRDPRYDWQRYRDRNRSIFRLGVYIDPFGWNYRPVSIGWQLQPNYYAQQYWLNDPSYYSLPLVSWPYRWVRYYDDALLIDLRTGQVVDAIQSFFW